MMNQMTCGLATALTLTVCLAGCGGGGGEGTCGYGGKTYTVGTTFDDTDGCNTCECRADGVACTLMACLGDGGFSRPDAGPDSSAEQTCTYSGKTYPYGVTFISADGCNECWCMGGQPTAFCTLAACSKDAAVPGFETSGGTCTYDGKSYPTGATFPSTDGCNTCECLWYRDVACTLKACLGDGGFPVDALPTDDATAGSCVYNGKTYPLDVYFNAADGCNGCHCGSDGKVTCTLNADCRQDAGPMPIDAPVP